MGISKTYGYQAPVYRAISSVDGGVYCLRRVEGESSSTPYLSAARTVDGLDGGSAADWIGYKVSSQDAFSAMEKWRQMRHPNIVSLREAFTTKAFNDNCKSELGSRNTPRSG
jgi:PAB-dependent poly(A)-specific ribonuclease subunit 3